MSFLTRRLGNVRMTTMILGLVMISIIGSIVAVSAAIYFNLSSAALAESRAEQETTLGITATILERRISGSALQVNEDGTLGDFNSWAIPPFYDTQIIDSVTRVTKTDAAVYALDPATGDLVVKTTSILLPDGARALESRLLASDPVVVQVLAGEKYFGPLEIDGVEYFAALQRIIKTNGEQVGAIFSGIPMAKVEAEATSVLSLIAMVGGGVVIALGLVGFVASRLITRPIPKLASAMDVIAAGNYEAEVPYTALGNEVGRMARAVEVFRENGLRVSQMTEADAARIIADEERRRQMMGDLQSAFGEVVDAAVAGDFSHRVEASFHDAELNALAGSVNNLVSTFDRGVSEIGAVLGAMANTDFTYRMTGEHQGALHGGGRHRRPCLRRSRAA